MVQLTIGPRAPKRWFERAGGCVGQIRVEVTVKNELDVQAASEGHLAAVNVRRATLSDVLVDTGATTLCLPADVVAALGLPYKRNAMAETAIGYHEIRVFGQATVALMGRENTFECVELPEGAPPLLGVYVLEGLGIEPNLRDEVLELRPETGPNGYLRI